MRLQIEAGCGQCSVNHASESTMTILFQVPSRLRHTLSAVLLVLMLTGLGAAGCVQAQSPEEGDVLETRNDPIMIEAETTVSEDIESRNGAITIGEEARVAHIEARNGAVTLDEGARAASIKARNGAVTLRGDNVAERIEARNGRISIGAESTINGSIETRNGRIMVNRESTVEGDIETRNGSVETEEGVRIAGEVETRNGSITLVGTQVDVLVDSRNGDIRLRGGTVVQGDVRLLMNENWSGSTPPVLSIDSESRVEGRLIVDERARVEIEAGAEVPEVERFASREDWERQQ